ncbi:MAG: HAD hydrolase-like protein [Candidatus Methanomethylophilaceae archaeon]|nr:HAD hydrolase-like protein [Candidatus Methanomethylophilaceae archaeon]
MIRLLIFDMDGTIADTSAGIYASYRHVGTEMNLPLPADSELSGVIGGSLPANLQRVYSLADDDVGEAVKIYRDYYAEEGYLKSELYDGFEETVVKLISEGYSIAIATLKAQRFAVKLTKHWGISDLFCCIRGVDEKDSVTKEEMIAYCISNYAENKDQCLMIGDAPQDYDAASANGIGFLAVTYGFCYTADDCISSGINYISDIMDLPRYLEENKTVI